MASGAKLDQAREVMRLALRIATNCHLICTRAPAANRRKLNQAFFKAVHVTGRKVTGCECEEPFASILANGSNRRPLVEVRGFEPLSSSDLPGLLRA